MNNTIQLFLCSIILTSLLACGGSDNGSQTSAELNNTENQNPVVDAGIDQVVTEDSVLTIYATASDIDGAVTGYDWQQIAGPAVDISNSQNLDLTIKLPKITEQITLTFELTVTDDQGGNAIDTVDITVLPVNTLPVADAGQDQTVNEETSVLLQARADDNDGTIISFNWHQTQGPSVNLLAKDSENTSFTSPKTAVPVTLTFEFTVFDNEGESAIDTVDIIVFPVNELPIAAAGPDQTVNEQASVLLQGSAYDNDGTIVSNSWNQLSGPNVDLAVNDGGNATFTSPKTAVQVTLTFALSAFDNEGGNAIDTVDIIVLPVNEIPVVDAGQDQNVNENSTLMLFANAIDPDGTIDSFNWQQIAGVIVDIANAQSPQATITVPSTDEPLMLTFEIAVTDNEGGIASDYVNINVLPIVEPLSIEIISETSVIEGSTVLLRAQVSGNDDQQLTFKWQQLTGVLVELLNSTEQETQFTAPSVDELSELSFQLSVIDADSNEISDQIIITVTNMPELHLTGLMNDTGIDTCSDLISTTLDCSGAEFGDQDGTHGRDATTHDNNNGHAGFDFTKIAADGTDLAQDANQWSCVRDNVSGFIWEVKTTDGDLQDSQHTYSWFNNENGAENGQANLGVCSGSGCDTSSYVNAVNQQGLCGANDWQVPTIRQLHSLIDYSRTSNGIAIGYEYFPNTLPAEYWSSTLFSAPLWVWNISFYNAIMKQTLPEAAKHVRLIRANNQ